MRRSNAEWQWYWDKGRGYSMSEPIMFELTNYTQALLKSSLKFHKHIFYSKIYMIESLENSCFNQLFAFLP